MLGINSGVHANWRILFTSWMAVLKFPLMEHSIVVLMMLGFKIVWVAAGQQNFVLGI